MLKKLFVVVVAALFTLSTLAACSTQVEETPIVVNENTPAAVIAEGRLLPSRSLELSFTTSGKVVEILVKDGDLVTEGQELARLEKSPEAVLAIARAKQELLAAQQALADLEEQDDPDVDDVALANAQLETAEASLESARAFENAAVLKANMGGTIVDLDLQVGQKVTPGIAVGSIADFSFWVVKTENLTETEVVNIAVGAPVEITLDAIPGVSLTGEVAHINARYEEKRGDIIYTVTINLTQTDPRMLWGMTAAARFIQ